jgi:quercetin dioxygenase-like cupin family protein
LEADQPRDQDAVRCQTKSRRDLDKDDYRAQAQDSSILQFGGGLSRLANHEEEAMADTFIARALGEALPEDEQPVWTAHPTFAGVRLSERVAGRQTEGAFRTLVVRLEPDALMAAHRHPHQVEQHFVLCGVGAFTLEGVERPYRAGDLQIIPKNAEHSVRAGASGMVLLALFSPASG